jgi:hypothetical protein
MTTAYISGVKSLLRQLCNRNRAYTSHTMRANVQSKLTLVKVTPLQSSTQNLMQNANYSKNDPIVVVNGIILGIITY